jgi:mannose-6-phosphate isomerase
LLGSPATFHKVEKPWGNYEKYTHNLPCTVKILTVAPGGTLSRQYHYNRDELWVGLDTAARVERGKEVLEPEAGRSCSFHVNSAQALGRR